MIDKTKPFAFQCVAEDIIKISQKLISDDKLCKLLYYTDKKPLTREMLTTEQKEELLDEEFIQVIPRIKENEENSVRNFILISYTGFSPSKNNKYMDGVIVIDILSHIDCWKITNSYGDLNLRPYEIAQRVYETIHDKKLTGIGKAQFMNGEDLILGSNPEYAGLTLRFNVVNSNS